MELIVRVHVADRVDDVIVQADATHTIGDLAEALSTGLQAGRVTGGVTSVRTGKTLAASTTIADAGVLSGDELLLGAHTSAVPARARPLRAVTADVLAGPDSGLSVMLMPGTYTIGRQATCDIVIADMSVSRAAHAEVEVGIDWSVTIRPMTSTNGVTVNDEPIDAGRSVGADDVVGLGGTRLAFRPFERSEHERIDRLGQVVFHRTPYRPPAVADPGDQTFGPIPSRPEPRRFQVLSAIAPLAAGLTMYAFSRQIQFLALTLMSPVMVVANSIEDRRSGRRSFRDQLASLGARRDEFRRRLESLRHRERIDRLHASPDLADLVRRAELRTIDLWARNRSAPDFLRLRLGLGTDAVRFGVELDNGGDDDLRDETMAVFAGLDSVQNVPITVDLLTDQVLGLHGERELVDGVASSLVVQAACLHSPEDVTVVAAVHADRPLGWLKWLPHTRSVTSPLPGAHVVTSTDQADALIRRLIEVAEFRVGTRRPGDDGRVWPRVFAVLDERLHPDAADLARLLDHADEAGMTVVWLADSAAGVPRQARRILEVRSGSGAAMIGRLWSTDPAVADRELEVEHLRPVLADRVARALAPVRDASTASLATSIPRVVPLLDVLGVALPDAQWVTERWLARRGYQLAFPIGIGADGVVMLDLVENGPHTLIGGTSGAGKSELLQSMVASLAANHPPDRLNFLFVDYKGGASTQVFERLPHTVGYVTNLEAELSLRALTSLRAELRRRMAVMEGRAKDLAEMLEKYPDEAPPSLVIVVDEFATLVKEVPEFIAGIVDIAQRGRSLGIHLVLATQRPSGSVNENISGNTNLRISLRMVDRAESTAVIDSPEAADIPVPLRGRGFVRLGPRDLIAFQSAFGGAPFTTTGGRQPILVAPFDRPDDTPRPVATAPSGGSPAAAATQLDVVLDAIVEASEGLSIPEQRRPWREVLPPLLTLEQVVRDPSAHPAFDHPGRFVAFGLLDAPEQQEQHPALVDLEEGGGWLVFGGGGSGKTTVLRTVAASVSACSEPDEVAIVAFDFASRGLAALRALPNVVDVVTSDDLEAVTRHLLVLERELQRRRRLLADAGAEHLTAYHRDHERLPRIVVLVDGFGGLAGAFSDGSGPLGSMVADTWGERVIRLIVDGRQVGIHAVLTADRRNAIPTTIQSAISNRLILRQTDENSYLDHGISGERARSLDLPPGRGLLQGTTVVQVASVTRDPSAKAQGEFLTRLGRGSSPAPAGRPRYPALASAPLPDHLSVASLPAVTDRPLSAWIGVEDVTAEPVLLDLAWSDVAVIGPARSGRSTALVTVASSLAGSHDVYAIGGPSSPLARLECEEVSIGRASQHVDLLERLVNLDRMGAGARARVLVVDDVDSLDDHSLSMLWSGIAETEHLRLVASLEPRAALGFHPVMGRVKQARRVLVLNPDDAGEFMTITGVRLPVRPGLRMRPGRGVLLVDRIPSVLQVAAT